MSFRFDTCPFVQPVHPIGDHSWVFFGRTDAEAETPILLTTWGEELTHQKRPWRWERLRAGGEGNDRGWDGWMASPSQMTWVWVDPGSWWWTGRPGMLRFLWSWRVGHSWVTEPELGEKNWLIRKYPDARKDWRLEEKGMIEDEMVGWHHQLNGHEFE